MLRFPPTFFPSILIFFLISSGLLAQKSRGNSDAPDTYVTAERYTAFLNAVAKEDPHLLYDEKMGLDSTIAEIQRVGEPGNYSYRVRQEQAAGPVMYVDIRSALRFCNWEKNGKQEDPSTTENGLYELEDDHLISIHIEEETEFFLPQQYGGESKPCLSSCLVLGSLEDPSSWMRSNQVIFHLESQMDLLAASLEKSDKRVIDNAMDYGIVGAGTVIAAIAACKYRNYLRRPRDLRLEETDKRNDDPRRLPDVRETRTMISNQRRSPSESPVVSEEDSRSSSSVTSRVSEEGSESSSPETKVQTVMEQVRSCHDRIHNYERNYPPDQVSLFRANLERHFSYQQRTADLDKILLQHRKNSDAFSKYSSFDNSNSIDTERRQIEGLLQQYADDFNKMIKKTEGVTVQQYAYWKELQEKERQLVEDVQPNFNRVADSLEGQVAISNEQDSIMRSRAVNQYFQKKFGDAYAVKKKALQQEMSELRQKFAAGKTYVRQLDFSNSSENSRNDKDATVLISQADREMTTMMQNYSSWKETAEKVITQAQHRYDATHLSLFDPNDYSLPNADKEALKKAVRSVDTNEEFKQYYPPADKDEQAYLQSWFQAQYDAIIQTLTKKRGLRFSSQWNASEQRVITHFLEQAAASHVECIREKAVVLQQAYPKISS